MNEHWTLLNSNVRSNTIRPLWGWAEPRRSSARSINRNRGRGRGYIQKGRGQTKGRPRDNPWDTVRNNVHSKNDNYQTTARNYQPKITKQAQPTNASSSSTTTQPPQSSLPPILQSMLGNEVNEAALQRLESLNINSPPKSKKKKQKKPKSIQFVPHPCTHYHISQKIDQNHRSWIWAILSPSITKKRKW